MSPYARRFFGCFLPLVLAVFGCGTMILVGDAARILVDLRTVPDQSMEPLLHVGWTVVLNNMAYWTDEPGWGDIVSITPDHAWALRRIVALPGQSIEVNDGVILLDGVPRDPGYTPIGRGPDAPLVRLGQGQYYVMADNRDYPDSREWGPIPRDHIYGRAIFQIDRSRTFHEVMVTPTPVRPAATATPGAP